MAETKKTETKVDKKTFLEKLTWVQTELKAPKNQTNTFGKYKYRSQEDILEAVKPLLHEAGLMLTIEDDIVIAGAEIVPVAISKMETEYGPRFYIKATCTITDGDTGMKVSALAREAENKKGMDEAQVTGAASSYARKYALNGLFLIDDTKDADATNDGKAKAPVKETKDIAPLLSEIIEAKDIETVDQIGAKIKEGAKEYSKEQLLTLSGALKNAREELAKPVETE